MVSSSISVVPEPDAGAALATLVSAFIDDPLARWMYADLGQYRTHFTRFVAALGGKSFAQRTAWRLGEFSAVALWLAPLVEPADELIRQVLTESIAPDRFPEMFSLVEQIDAAHPISAVWYLPWFGVEGPSQGAGLGGQLMGHCLRVVDAAHGTAYLETANPRNISFYERHGFKVTGEAQTATCPRLTFMLRPEREVPPR